MHASRHIGAFVCGDSRVFLPVLIFVLASGGCTHVRRPEVSELRDPVAVEGPAATLVVARAKRICGPYEQHFLEVDDRLIAVLANGQHTRLRVGAGSHRMTVIWSVRGLYPPALTFSRTVAQVFDPAGEYRLMLADECYELRPSKRVKIEIVEAWPAEITLEPESFVSPGPVAPVESTSPLTMSARHQRGSS